MRSMRRWTRMSGLTSQPCLGSLVEALRHTERDTGLDPEAIRRAQLLLGGGARPVRRLRERPARRARRRSICTRCRAASSPTSRSRRARSASRRAGTRWRSAYRDANDLFGDIVKVTPSSKVVGDMALMMVAQGLTAADVARPGQGDRLPGLGGRDAARRSRPAARRLARGAAEEGAEGRAADHRAAGLAAARRPTSPQLRVEAEKRCGRSVDEQRARLLPDVSQGVRRLRRGRTQVRAGRRCCRRRSIFYGMSRGEEITIELEQGKTLVVRLQAIGETDEEGQVRVFFELNGQPRIVKRAQPRRGRQAAGAPQGRGRQRRPCRAPRCRASVSTISVARRPAVKAGDVLLTIEAMKMETALHAPRDGVVEEVLVHAGQPDRRQGSAGGAGGLGKQRAKGVTVASPAPARKGVGASGR